MLPDQDDVVCAEAFVVNPSQAEEYMEAQGQAYIWSSRPACVFASAFISALAVANFGVTRLQVPHVLPEVKLDADLGGRESTRARYCIAW